MNTVSAEPSSPSPEDEIGLLDLLVVVAENIRLLALDVMLFVSVRNAWRKAEQAPGAVAKLARIRLALPLGGKG